MRNPHSFLSAALCLIPVALTAQRSPAPAASPSHHEAVTSRGDDAMGFSHETTTHHFRLYNTGGAIEVSANDPKDFATRDEIRMHLSHIVNRFAAGDFAHARCRLLAALGDDVADNDVGTDRCVCECNRSADATATAGD